MIERKFIIGDKWLYFKIYSGPKTLETILCNDIFQFISKLQNKNIISKWFFVKYSHPEFHIRLRLLVINNNSLGYILNNINIIFKYNIINRLIHNVEICTYNREIERYGKNNMEFSESIFYYDSILAINLLTFIKLNPDDNLRWLSAIKSIDSFLNDFNYDLNMKLKLTDELQDAFGKEFNIDKNLRIQINNKFRKYREEIYNIINNNNFLQDKAETFLNIFENRSQNIFQYTNLNSFFNNFNKDQINLIIKNYLHMMLNRIFLTRHRLNEFIIYSLLFKHYLSELHRKGK